MQLVVISLRSFEILAILMPGKNRVGECCLSSFGYSGDEERRLELCIGTAGLPCGRDELGDDVAFGGPSSGCGGPVTR